MPFVSQSTRQIMLRNFISSSTLVTLGAGVLGLLAIVGVFAAALWLIRLATPRNHVADYAQRIQGPQEAPGPVERD